ncbi:MAG: TolC family protein [Candidatus Omnitrophica bacterium]|nr:TolC family protein [Candidatus Omnitrophota bacterium]
MAQAAEAGKASLEEELLARQEKELAEKSKAEREEWERAAKEEAKRLEKELLEEARIEAEARKKALRAEKEEVERLKREAAAEAKLAEEKKRKAEAEQERLVRQAKKKAAAAERKKEQLEAGKKRKAEAALRKQEARQEQKARWYKDVGYIGEGEAPKEPTLMSLDECIETAVANSLQLQVATKSVKLAEMRVWEARRNMLPTFKAVWQEYTGRINGQRYYGKKEYMEGQQPIFHGGELFFTMKQAETNLSIVKKDYDRIRNELVLQVRRAYFSLAKSVENLRVQKELAAEIGKIAGMTKKEAEEGLVSKIEALNVEAKTNQTHFQLVSAEGDVEVAELILKQAMYLAPNDRVSIAPKFKFRRFNVDFERTLRAAFMYRPEIAINAMSIEYYKYEKDVAKAKGWPKIDFMGNWGMAKEHYVAEDFDYTPVTGDVERKLSQQWYAGIKASMPAWGNTMEYSQTREQWVPVVSTYQGTQATTTTVTLNLLDNLKYFSDKQSADIDLSRAKQEFVKVKQDVTLEVKEGCFNYQKSLIEIDTALKKVEYQTKDLEFMKFRRQMDEALDSDVIESMTKLGQEKFGHSQAMNDYYVSVASINKAVGLEDYLKLEEEPGSAAKK